MAQNQAYCNMKPRVKMSGQLASSHIIVVVVVAVAVVLAVMCLTIGRSVVRITSTGIVRLPIHVIAPLKTLMFSLIRIIFSKSC
jgi:hypothetical protein